MFPTSNFTSLEWQCWTESSRRLTPAFYHDCRAVAEGFQGLPPRGQPLVFGTLNTDEVDYRIPMSLTFSTCSVRILPLSTGPHVIDTFTHRYLSHAINRLGQQCVIPAPHLGGEGGIGKKGVIGLVVAGLLKPRESFASNRLVIKQGIGLEGLEDGLED